MQKAEKIHFTLISDKIPEKKFVRYKINTEQARPRYKLPHPFNPKVKKIGLAKLFIKEIFEYNFKLLKKEYRQTLFSRPCIYGVFSRKVGGFAPIRDRCVGCLRCVQEYPEVVTVDRNLDYTHYADSFWMPLNPDQVSTSPFATIWWEAERGKIMIRGMGYKGLFASKGWDSIWTDMSEIVRPTRDGVYGREYISTVVNIGRKMKYIKFPIESSKEINKTVTIPIPVIFDVLPDKLSSPSIKKSIIKSSEQLNTYYISDSKDGNHDNNRILLINEESFIHNVENIKKAKIIEFEDSGNDLHQRIKLLNDNAPIIARLKFEPNFERRVLHLAKNGVSGFHLYADYHGYEFNTENPRFIKDLIRFIHNKLVQEKIRDEVTLIVSGGIILAEHIPKAIICGANLIAINTTILVALQSKFKTECRFPEQSEIELEKFDSNWGSQRLVNLMGSWHNQLIEILSAMGQRDVRRLVGDVGRAIFKEEIESEAFEGIERTKEVI